LLLIENKIKIAILELLFTTLFLYIYVKNLTKNNKHITRYIILNKYKILIPNFFGFRNHSCICFKNVNSLQIHDDFSALSISAKSYPHIFIENRSLEDDKATSVIYKAIKNDLDQRKNCEKSFYVDKKAENHNSWAYYSLASVMLLIHLFFYLNGTLFDAIVAGGSGKSTLKSGDYYRLFTAIFLHLNFVHIFFNVCLLALYSRIVGVLIGTVRFFNLFFISGVAGFLASNILSNFDYVIGASGAIYGLIGSFIVIRTKYAPELPPTFVIASLKFIVLTILLDLAISFSNRDHVDFYSHLIGFLFGALYTLNLSRNSQSLSKLAKHNRNELILTIIIGLCFCYSLVMFSFNFFK